MTNLKIECLRSLLLPTSNRFSYYLQINKKEMMEKFRNIATKNF